jgi:histidinol dehydrogenase
LNGTLLKIVDLTSHSEEEISGLFRGGFKAASPGVLRTVRDIIEDVRRRGDEALCEYTRRYDHVDLTPSEFRLSAEEVWSCIGQPAGATTVKTAGKTAGSMKDIHGVSDDEHLTRTGTLTPAGTPDPALDTAMETAIRRVREFHEREVYEDWSYRDEYGNLLGRKWTPIERVGVYVPGGKACYPSTLIMTVVPALVAGVKEISVVSPPSSFTPPSSLALAIQKIGGVSSVYRVGGVQALAALAFGTATVQRVDKIVGPGNIYVTVAKKELFGFVDIDMIAGPSEVLVIADGSVDPKLTAVDLLAQAEHDEQARALCITTSEAHARAISGQVAILMESSKRRAIIESSLKNNGRIYVVKDEKGAVSLANAIAPEHLELHMENPQRMLLEIRNAGAIFLGRLSPEALGDYVAGPSHVLPTGGSARFSSPLSVLSFMKFSSIIDISNRGFGELGGHASVMAEAEGLASHAGSVQLRREE